MAWLQCGQRSENLLHNTFARFLKELDHLFALNGGKVIEKLIDGSAFLKIISERLYRYAGSSKDGCSTENLRIGNYNDGSHAQTVPRFLVAGNTCVEGIRTGGRFRQSPWAVRNARLPG